MNSSRTLATESFSPWKKHMEWAPRVHENASSPSGGAQSIHGNMIHESAQASHDIPAEAIQYASPLSAYSTDFCGASSAFSDYNRSLHLRTFSGKEDIPILSPRIVNRLNSLRKLKSAGYTTLAPIGLNRTMKQIESDKLADSEDGAYVQAENSVNVGASTMGEPSSLHDHNLSSSSAAAEIPPTSMLLNSMDRDLDRQIVDADTDDSADLDADLNNDGHDAFMAEDVEYQYDHSLILDSTSGSAGPGDVNITFSAIADLSSAPNAGAPHTADSASSRPCDDSDIDMTLED